MRKGKRGGKRASKLSFDDLWSSIGRNSSRQELKFIALMRATRIYQKCGISLKIQRMRVWEIKDFRLGMLLTCATTLQEVGILPTWFISNLRAILR